MNIEKLETILHEMQAAAFVDAATANQRIRDWADRISAAITEHLLAELGGGTVGEAPDLSTHPGGHGWDGDGH